MYTTKQVGERTGLGLIKVYDAIRRGGFEPSTRLGKSYVWTDDDVVRLTAHFAKKAAKGDNAK